MGTLKPAWYFSLLSHHHFMPQLAFVLELFGSSRLLTITQDYCAFKPPDKTMQELTVSGTADVLA